jgi:hypothetical protein
MHGGVPNHPEHEMSGGDRMRTSSILAGILVAALAVAGCLQSEPTAGGTTSGSGIQDPGLLAGATSSTNWPQEDAGFHHIEISGTVDSTLTLAFMQKLETTGMAKTVRLSGTVTVYRCGYIPVFDSVPSIRLKLAMTDTFRISSDQLNPLFPKDMDTLRFMLEFRTDSTMALAPGFFYSRKQGKFVDGSSIFSDQASLQLTDPHYKFAGFPDSAFSASLADTTENIDFYYYIPGSPYFWRHSFAGDTLLIGPTVSGSFPLRCVKITTHAGPKTDYSVEIFPLSLVKETVNDSIHHFEQIKMFELGSPVLQTFGQGTPSIRNP